MVESKGYRSAELGRASTLALSDRSPASKPKHLVEAARDGAGGFGAS